jgi:hypothetical protein
MSKESWLLTCAAILGAYNAGVIWLVQISGYPLWPHVGRGEFLRFYAVWSSGAWGMLFVPLLLALAGAAVLLLVRPHGVPVWTLWLGLALQVALVLFTVRWWSPSASHITTSDGSLNLAAYARLMHSHWLRVAMVTIYAVLACWMLSCGLWPQQHSRPQVSQWVLLGAVAFGFYGIGQIWLVQSLCYRLWPQIGRSDFFGYHMAWWHSIWIVIFVPSGLAFLGALALPWLRPPEASLRLLWAGLGVQVLLYVLTAVWWGPLMGRLATREQGLLLHNYHLLMTTHWVRVAIVSAYGLVALWTLVQSATPSQTRFQPSAGAGISGLHSR